MTSFGITPPSLNPITRSALAPSNHPLSPVPFTPKDEYHGKRKHHSQSAERNHFSFHSQINGVASFPINQLDEDSAEEKMHSPRTPYNSVPDPAKSQFNFRSSSGDYLAPTLQPIQRTISASSIDSCISVRSSTIEPPPIDRERSMNLHYAQSYGSLSINSSINALPISATSSCNSLAGSLRTTPGSSPKRGKHTASAFVDEYKTPEAPEPRCLEEGEQQHHPFDDEEKAQSNCKKVTFGERMKSSVNARDSNIEPQAIQVALEKIKTKKHNDFRVYRHGLNTYSNGGSGYNSAGTATPTSIGAMSCGSIRGPESESSYDGRDVLEEGDVFNSSGCSTPLMSLEPEVSHLEEDELDTPIPASSKTGSSGGRSSFGFGDISTTYTLAQINEAQSDEHPQLNVTPSTQLNDSTFNEMKDCSESTSLDHEVLDPARFDLIDESDDEDEPAPTKVGCEMDLEEEILLKGSRFQSSRVLFLDVDGVLLSTTEQAHLGKGENIKFNDDVTCLMEKLYRETDCDIVVSSTWQFYKESHLRWLINYLVACGWRRDKIHTLLDLLPSHANDGVDYGREWYEQSPYCQCRARGIQKIVELYGSYITAWCALDDLPLHSQKMVCIPKKEDINTMVANVAEAYLKCISWRNEAQKLEDLEGVKYCVKYALTQLPSCIFSSQSYRFGYEYNQTMIYFQADAIAKCIAMTREIPDNATYQATLQNMMAVMNQYLATNLTYQGDPHITPYLIQTDQNTGITPPNIENAITLLTYDTVQRGRYRNANHGYGQQMQSPNDWMNQV